MLAESSAQRGFMGLVAHFKKTGSMPKASGGKPLPKDTQTKVRKAAGSMSMAQIVDFLRTRKRG